MGAEEAIKKRFGHKALLDLYDLTYHPSLAQSANLALSMRFGSSMVETIKSFESEFGRDCDKVKECIRRQVADSVATQGLASVLRRAILDTRTVDFGFNAALVISSLEQSIHKDENDWIDSHRPNMHMTLPARLDTSRCLHEWILEEQSPVSPLYPWIPTLVGATDSSIATGMLNSNQQKQPRPIILEDPQDE